jgi:DNA mismatch endonuclease (patch repair protein)
VNRRFWVAKIWRNQQRDRDIDVFLLHAGIRPIRFWEHELRDAPSNCVRRLLSVLSRRSKAGR